MSNTETKLFPENPHMAHYEGWHFLGNDGEVDYYVLPWELVNQEGRLTLGGVPWLSIVFSNEPSNYASPSYDHLFSDTRYSQHPRYKKLYELLLANGYHATGRTVA